MKADGLLSLLTFSEKRKDILLLLKEHPRTPSEIKDNLKVTAPEIAKRINEMKDSHLIAKDEENGVYYLTEIGEIVAANFIPFLNTLAAIEANEDFWARHDLSSIPTTLLHRIKDLHNCAFVKSAMCNQFEPHKEFTYWVANSTEINGLTGVFNPAWVSWFSEVSELGIQITLIMTKEIYNKTEREYYSELIHGLQNPNAHIYVYDGELKVAASTMRTLDGVFFSFGLHFRGTGQYDNNLDLQGCDMESFRWGEELFEYYKEMAVEVPRVSEVREFVYPDGSKVAGFNLV